MPRPPEGLTAVSCRKTQGMPVVPTILLVDGDGNYRRMVKDMILRHYPDVSVAEARTSDDAMRQVSRNGPRLIFTEIDLRGRRALDLPRRMAAARPASIIAVLTSYDQPEYREAVLHSGAHHFISKSVPTGRMILNIVDAELIEPAVRENTRRGDRDDVTQ